MIASKIPMPTLYGSLLWWRNWPIRKVTRNLYREASGKRPVAALYELNIWKAPCYGQMENNINAFRLKCYVRNVYVSPPI